MKIDRYKINELKEAAMPLMKFLAENFHPHVRVIVDSTSAEMVEGVATVRTMDFIKD